MAGDQRRRLVDAEFLVGVHFNAAGNSVVCFRPDSGCTYNAALFDRIRAAIINIQGYRPDIFALVDDRVRPWHLSFWNADGSPETVCVNALRCMVPLASLRKIPHPSPLLEVCTDHARFMPFMQEDGMAGVFIPNSAVRIARQSSTDYFVDVGTPHRVKVVANVSDPHVQRLGLALSQDISPVNATFLQLHQGEIQVRTFERGVGETGSCGSGALASYVVAQLLESFRQISWEKTSVRFRSGEILVVGTDEKKSRYFVVGDVSSPRPFCLELPKQATKDTNP